jgi:serine phosphatase RsbU (regulator of sigma subunit)
VRPRRRRSGWRQLGLGPDAPARAIATDYAALDNADGRVASSAGVASIPLVLIAFIVTADVLSPAMVHLGPLLVVAPAFTAAIAGPRLTALIGALSLLALAAIGVIRDVLYTQNLTMQTISLAVLSVFLVVFCIVRERRAGELGRVRTVAEAVQRLVLRELPLRAGPLSIASRYRAAQTDADIGGDLYAVARTGSATRLIIADVRGKGLASVSDATLLLGAFRATEHQEPKLPELMAYLEGSICSGRAELVQGGADAEERFATAAVLDIADDEPVVQLVNCGHPPPLLLRSGNAIPLQAAEATPPLGLGAMVDGSYQVTTHRFAGGDMLLLYTDGVSEGRDRHGDFYPLAERVARWTTLDPEDLLARIITDLGSHMARPPDDDLAMIAIKRQSQAAGMSARVEPAGGSGTPAALVRE